VHVRPYSGNSSSILWKDIYRNITYADCELDFEVTNKDEIYNKGWSDGWDEAVKSEIPKMHPKLKGSDPDYWTRLEHQYAGMAMQGFISSKRGLNIETDMYDIPYYSQMLAHALVEKMKNQSV